MAITGNHEFPYIEGTDSPDLPANNKLLAEMVEALLATRIQYGEAEVVGTGANTVDLTVTFDPPFEGPPQVIANYLTTPGGSTRYYVIVRSITATAAELRIKREGSGSFSDLRRLCWMAIRTMY